MTMMTMSSFAMSTTIQMPIVMHVQIILGIKRLLTQGTLEEFESVKVILHNMAAEVLYVVNYLMTTIWLFTRVSCFPPGLTLKLSF